jgi:hypothetical protein
LAVICVASWKSTTIKAASNEPQFVYRAAKTDRLPVNGGSVKPRSKLHQLPTETQAACLPVAFS